MDAGPLSGPSVQQDGKRFAAIMFADVVDFTALAARDEDAALAQLDDFMAAIVAPLLDRHGAGLRKHLGDGLLATFDGAGSGVDCAEALQAALGADRAGPAPRWPGLRLRISVHLADVRFEHGDVLGHGVNLAKRLQEAGAPGSVILSQPVCDAVRDSHAGRLRDLGFLALKGLGRPIRAFDLGTEEARGPTGATPRAEDELPSIAALPFESLGAREEDRYFADGLVEDIIGSLSGLREMIVIARGSTLSFRDRQIDPRDARRVLGVRYVLQGTVRRRKNAIRLSATLSDTETGVTMFSTHSDIKQDDLFDEQDRLVNEIVATIAPHVRQAELARAIRKPPEVFSAYDRMLRALDLMRHLDPKCYAEARALLDAATQDDPGFAAAHAWKAAWVMVMVAQGWLTDRQAAAADAEASARRAVQLDEHNALALATLGHALAFLRGDHEAALAFHERARAVGPGNPIVLMMSAGSMAYVGRGEEAVDYAEAAHQLVPLDHIPFREYDWLSLANYAAGNYVRAAYWARRALDSEPGHLPSLRLLAASLAATGDLRSAGEAARTLTDCDPDFRVGPYAEAHATFADPSLQRLWLSHLLEAGLPE